MKKAPSKPSRRTPKDFVLGRQHFAKISAIEGIHLTAEMEADFAEFDRLGLSPEERRKAILRKYGKAGGRS
jgi:hypothetical protein